MRGRTVAGALAMIAMLSVVGYSGYTVYGQEKTVMVGGAAMYPSKDIIDNAVNSKDHTTLVAAVKAGGPGRDAEGEGAVHGVRADQRRVRQASGRHRRHAVETRSQEDADGHPDLSRRGREDDSVELMTKAKAMNGKVELKTVKGDKLWVVWKDNALWLQDGKNNTARITIADVYQSNGVIHVIDTVVMPG